MKDIGLGALDLAGLLESSMRGRTLPLQVGGVRKGERRRARNQGMTEIEHGPVADLLNCQRVDQEVHCQALNSPLEVLPQPVARSLDRKSVVEGKSGALG